MKSTIVCGTGFWFLFFLLIIRPAYALREFTVNYFISKDTCLKAQLWLPDTGRRFPAIVLYHEGGFVHGDRACFSEYAEYFTSKGFAAMGVGYRLMKDGGGYPQTVRDALHAYAWLSQQARKHNIDSTRLFVLGSSAGAYLAAMVCVAQDLVTKNPADYPDVRFSVAPPAGAVFSYGVYEWETSRWKGDGFLSKAEWNKASPIRYAPLIHGPVLFFAGRQDPLFGADQAISFASMLRKAGCRVDLQIRETGGHGGICYRKGELAQWEAGALDVFLNNLLKKYNGRNTP